MGKKFDYDVFLSHNSKDKPRVRRLAERLRKAGMRVWLDESVIKPGDDIYLAIEHGLESSRALILCMSNAAFGSGWVALERSTVIFRDPTNEGRRFIPLLLENCEIPDAIRRYKYVDWKEESEATFKELCSACGFNKPDVATVVATALDPKVQAKRKETSPELQAAVKAISLGHTEPVNGVAVTPDGSLAVSGSDDKTVRVWDLEKGRCIATLEGHSASVRSVAVTADGRRAVSGSLDNTVRVWDLEKGRCSATLEEHSDSVNSIAVTADGLWAVSGSDDETVRVWNLEKGRCIAMLEGHSASVLSVAVTPDGLRAVSGSSDNTVRVWGLEKGRRIATLKGHSDSVTSVAVTADGLRAVSGSSDNTVRVWDLEKGRCIETLEGHSAYVTSVAATTDGLRAVSGSDDNTVRVWDLEKGRCIVSLKGHSASVLSVAVTSDGLRAVSGSDDATVQVWSLKKGRRIATLEGHSDSVLSVAATADRLRAVSGSRDKTVRVWDLERGRCLATLEGHSDSVRSVAVTADGLRAVSGSTDKTVRVWDLSECRCLATLEGHSDSVRSVAVTADGLRAVSGSSDNTVRVWDLEKGRCLSMLEGHSAPVLSVAVTADGLRTVSGSTDKTVRVWDSEKGRCLCTLQGHSGPVWGVAITADGLRAVSGSVDKTVRVWNLEEGRCNATLEGHSDSVWGVAVTADGLRAVSGSDDNTVRVWDLKKGRCIATLHGHSDYVSSVAVAADGLRILSAAMNGVLRIWPMAESVKFGAIRAEDQRTYTNAKVVLVGESGVGKSGLAYRLIEDRFIETHSTHGMQVWQLDLPKAKKGSKEREALLWDLAGQEDYRIINQLFLDETALALALINPQKDDPFSDAVNWVKALRAAVTAKNPEREVAKLLIAARIDVGSIKVSQQKIDSFMQEHGFADYLPTSAQTGENCSDALNGGEPSALKKLVAAHIPWDTLPLTNTPLLLTEIKNAAFDMRDKKDVRLLRFSELCQRLESALPDQSFTNADVRTAVTLLANQGLVKPLKFGDLVLLKPEMLNGYAGAVIRAARKHKDEIGCVCEADIYDETFDFSGVERLERPDEELLLRAMVQTFVDESLCIAEDTPDGRQLIFPSQYRRERKIEKYPAIFVSYSFSGELQTIYTTLVVKLWYSREFEQKELWKDAVEFTTSKGKTVGFTMKSAGEGDGTISVFFEAGVPDELKWAFIKYVHDHLSRYACNVTRDRHYVCKCGKEVVDREAVRKRIAAKKKFIVCQDCDKKVVLIDHVETCLASDPVALRVLGMEKKAEQEKDTQALEQILIGHMMAICGEANQIFRPVSMFDYGIDGEVEFKDKDGKASGRKIYVQLKSGASYLRIRKSDGKEIFDVKNERHLEYWQNQPVDVYLVIRGEDEIIRWMNVTRYLKEREDKRSKQIIFEGERLDAPAIWRVRDQFFPKSLQK